MTYGRIILTCWHPILYWSPQIHILCVLPLKSTVMTLTHNLRNDPSNYVFRISGMTCTKNQMNQSTDVYFIIELWFLDQR